MRTGTHCRVTFQHSPKSVYIWNFVRDIIVMQLFMIQSELLITVMKWCSKKWYRMLCLCGVHRYNLILSTSRKQLSCLYWSQDVFAWLPDCVWQIYYAYSCSLLCETSNDFSTEWTQCCCSCSSACVTLHGRVAHMLACWFQFLCREPKWDSTSVHSLLVVHLPVTFRASACAQLPLQ